MHVTTLRSKRAKDKVISAYVKDPLATVREIAKVTGVGKSAVAVHKKAADVGGLKDDRIVSLTDADYDLVRQAQVLLARRLSNKTESDKISARDLNYIGDVSAKRYAIFRGDLTDSSGGLKFAWDTDTPEDPNEACTPLRKDERHVIDIKEDDKD